MALKEVVVDLILEICLLKKIVTKDGLKDLDSESLETGRLPTSIEKNYLLFEFTSSASRARSVGVSFVSVLLSFGCRQIKKMTRPKTPIIRKVAGSSHNIAVMQAEPWLEQDEIPVTSGQEVENLLVAVARRQALAHENAEVAGKRCIRIVDRLVLAHHAAQFAREIARARLEPLIGQHFIRLHRNGRRCADDRHK